MTKREISFEYTKESETLRYLYTAERIFTYFYQKNSFYLLSNIRGKNYNQKVVIFPKMDVTKSPRFWEMAKYLWQKDPKLNPFYKELMESLKFQITEAYTLSSMSESFKEVFPDFYVEFHQSYPQLLIPYNSIKVLPTRFGTSCSRFVNYNKKISRELSLYWREDAPISEPLGMYVFSVLQTVPEYKAYSWEKLIALKDFVITKSALNKYVEGYICNKSSKSVNEYKDESDSYYRELGFPKEKIFKIEGTDIICTKGKLSLTQKENRFLSALIRNSGNTVSFDKLAEEVWGENSYDKFSINALAKVAERLRKKIRFMGIYPEIIETVWGMGYLLRD